MTPTPSPALDPSVALAQRLIACRSLTPDKSEAQQILLERLSRLKFSCRRLEQCGCNNFWARLGTKSPLIVFSGHTDVVPPGDVKLWSQPPFAGAIKDGMLWGRGAADMKGSLAAMLCAVEAFLGEQSAELPFSLAFLVTGDEERGGAAAEACLAILAQENVQIDYCVVGEPTSENCLGDTIKIGRRGSLTGWLESCGTQGHVGYPHKASNAIHNLLGPLRALTQQAWDQASDYFEPSAFQVTSVTGGVANNVIPGAASAEFNFRFPMHTSPDALKARVVEILNGDPAFRYTLSWKLQSEPFLTEPGALLDVVRSVVSDVTGVSPKLSTAGGTSDARYFAKHGAKVLELGPLNATIHQIDERVAVADLIALAGIYRGILDGCISLAGNPSAR